MGLDGGTIPTRGELVQVKKKPEQKDKAADALHKWNNCTITQSPLEVPIVVCHLGMLFNKRSILEMLLGKLNLTKCTSFKHIESLKDVRELRLTSNQSRDARSSPYVCPITGLEMNGKHRFVCLWKCGCVLTERAIKEVPSPECHKCGREYTDADVVVINPNDGDLEVLKQRMIQRKSLRRKSAVEEGGGWGGKEEKGSKSDSTCTVTMKRKLSKDSPPTEHQTSEPKSKRHKKHHKHKKSHKHNKESKHKKEKKQKTDSSPPQIHPGWAGVLNKRNTYR